MHQELRQSRIPVAGPSITEHEIARVTEAVSQAWFERANIYHQRFEESFAAYLNVAHAVALPSCTSAIHLSLAALGIGPGDEIIVPDITWIASAAPISYVGATPVFADVDADSWCITPESFEARISERTRAVIPVDLYGGMPDLKKLRASAARHDIKVVEDAAEAFGSRIGDRPAGSFGDTGVFSFHGSKTLTTGEGGMLTTDDDALWQRVQALRDHGRAPGDRHFRNTEIAFKYKMSAMQAALGLAQLERAEELIAGKRRLFSWYRNRLQDIDGITLNHEAPGTTNSYWMITVMVDPRFGLDKEALMEALDGRNIDSRPFFHPLSSLPPYATLEQAQRAARENVVSYRLSPYGLNLPSGLQLTEADVDYVCNALLEVLGISVA